MNPFSWNHALIAIVVTALLVLVRKGKTRAAILTFMAVYGIVFTQYIHWILGLIYISMTFGILVIGWKFGNSIAGHEGENNKGKIILGMILLFSPLFLLKLLLALIPAAAIKTIEQNAPGFSLQALIPIGISYFSFRSAAYMVEIHRKTIEPVGFWRFAHYALFWPTLLAGPIERPGRFLSQSSKMVRAGRDDIVEGFARVITGYLKKIVLASLFFGIARPYLEMGAQFEPRFSEFSIPHLWLCVTAYYLYLYCDFSAYSDLAIGVSRMMGFRIMENFRWPILATNISAFWQRWHISLTSWVTDYIYRPLGGNKKGLANAARFTLIAMIVVGAWHGMNLHFIAWGIYHGVFLILYRQWRKVWKGKWFAEGTPGPGWLKTGAAWFFTFQVVNLGWVLFNFPVGRSIRIWLKMFGLG